MGHPDLWVADFGLLTVTKLKVYSEEKVLSYKKELFPKDRDSVQGYVLLCVPHLEILFPVWHVSKPHWISDVVALMSQQVLTGLAWWQMCRADFAGMTSPAVMQNWLQWCNRWWQNWAGSTVDSYQSSRNRTDILELDQVATYWSGTSQSGCLWTGADWKRKATPWHSTETNWTSEWGISRWGLWWD